MFWSRSENPCWVYALCGDTGLCCESGRHPCDCLTGFSPSDPAAWGSGDYLGDCSLEEGGQCNVVSAGCEFEEVGPVEFDRASMVFIPTQGRDSCQQSCVRNCSCQGLNFDSQARMCRNFYGNLFNLRNSTVAPFLYIKVGFSSSFSKNKKDNSGGQWRTVAISIGSISVLLTILGAAFLAWMLWERGRRKRKRGRRVRGGGEDDDDVLVMSNLRVFSYKELSTATRSFSEELGHGGFGAVFRGELPDSSLVAVKRVQRPGGDDREFHAEVRTIGSIQHINLVRLRGFCSEDPHRRLVYEYMPRGPLSAYLGRPPSIAATISNNRKSSSSSNNFSVGWIGCASRSARQGASLTSTRNVATASSIVTLSIQSSPLPAAGIKERAGDLNRENGEGAHLEACCSLPNFIVVTVTVDGCYSNS